jgi:hypothetical protein
MEHLADDSINGIVPQYNKTLNNRYLKRTGKSYRWLGLKSFQARDAIHNVVDLKSGV